MTAKFGKKEKEIMEIKVTRRLTYPEARKGDEQHKPEFTFSKIVQSVPEKPETKTTSTQYSETDCETTESYCYAKAKTKHKFSIYKQSEISII